MAVDPYRMDYDPLNTTKPAWIRKDPRLIGDMGSTTHNYQFQQDIGIDTVLRRWPLRPLDRDAFMVYMTANKGCSLLLHDVYWKYAGITLNPQFNQMWETILEKNAEVLMPVGHEAVMRGHMVMPDDAPAFGNEGTDVIRQHIAKQYTIAIKTAVTAAVNNPPAGYAAGVRNIVIDTVAGGFGIQVGDTISITTGGVPSYHLVRRIVYNVAGTDAAVELAWPLQVAIADNDVISTQHVAGAPIFFPMDSEYFENGKEILNAIHRDQSGPTYLFQQIEADGAPAAGVSMVLEAFQGINSEGHPGIHNFIRMDAGDILHLLIEFWDDMIRPCTVGKSAVSPATIRTTATVAPMALIELKC